MTEDRDEMYDWPIIGIPSEFIFEEGANIGYEDERWKMSDLPDTWVSDYGRFYNEKTKHFYKPTHGDDHGHKAIKNGKRGHAKQEYAHRLIAKAFIPNPNNLPIVRHLDDCPENNEISNLAWGTQKDNIMDAKRNGRTFTPSPEVADKRRESSRKPVKAIREKDGQEIYCRSIQDCAAITGAHSANIFKVLRGYRKRSMGYTYEYISKEEYNEKRSH